MSDFEIKELRKKYRNDNNLDRPAAILSAVNGSVYDTNDPTSGKVWVRLKQGGGWGIPTLVRGPVGTNIKLAPGMGVFLEKDEEDQLYVAGIRFSSLRSEGVNPLAGNVNDPQTSKMISQDNLVTLLAYSRGGTKFGIKAWMPIVNGIQYVYLGEQGDFTDYPTGSTTNLMPGAGQQCIACMALKNDYSTSEIALSTAVPIGATITTTDLQAALSGLSAGSTAVAYWLLEGTDKASIYLDVRQVVNTEVASATAPTDAIIKAPSTTTRNTIQGTAIGVINLILKLFTGQTAAYIEGRDASNNVIWSINKDGIFSAASIQNTAIGTVTPASGFFSALRVYIGGFAGIFTHANDANRTYTFPNRNITVAGTDVASGGTGSDLSGTGPGYARQASSGAALTILKNNLTATAAPGATDDGAAGYAIGSQWIDTVAKKEYVLVDATNSAAIWKETTITDTDTGITQLTGDVTAGPGSGSQAATVASVGGKSAGQVAAAVNVAHVQGTDSGTTQTSFDIDSGGTGVKLKNSSGALWIRNLLDNAYANLRAALGTFTTLIVGGTSLDASAVAQIDSTTQGFAAPRMTTTQRDAISSPLEGLMIYNTTTHQYEMRTNSAWAAMSGSSSSGEDSMLLDWMFN